MKKFACSSFNKNSFFPLQYIFILLVFIFGVVSLIASGGGDDNEGGGSTNSSPTATITKPTEGVIYSMGNTVIFTGSGNDAEDGVLNGSSMVWTSNIDGDIGTGTSVTRDDLSLGNHSITLTAIDKEGDEGSDVVNISVKAWTHPVDLADNISPDGSHANYDPQVAMDNNGNAIITWSQYDGSNYYQVFMSEYRNGVWHHPVDLADNISPDGQNTYSPQVAMDNNGNAIITWQQYDGSTYQIFMSEYRNGTWTHPVSLSDNINPDGSYASSPQVAMDDNGNAIITWYQYDGSKDQIFMNEYRNGGWTHPIDLSDNISSDGQNAYFPQVAMDNSGNAIITWCQWGDSTYTQIFMSEYRNGAWTHPIDLSDNISPDGQEAWSWYPQVAMDNSGNAIITWQQYDGSKDQIFMSEYRNGAWTHPVGLADNISPDGQNAWSPQVAMDNNGNAIITWDQSQIFMSEYRNGTWTHPVSLSDNISPDGQGVGAPKVAMDNSGNAIITWYQSDGSNLQIFKSEYR